MGNASSWATQALCPDEQLLWVVAKRGDLATLQEALARATPATRSYLEWRDPVYGYTPLLCACAGGHAECVAALLHAGAAPRVADIRGLPPLHLAIKFREKQVIRVLLQHGSVDIFQRTQARQQTVLDYAREEFSNSHERRRMLVECIELLEKKICVYTGWLYQRADNVLSLASGLSGLNSWCCRYGMVLRTADPGVVEIDLFAMKPGEKRPTCPSMELIYRVSDGIQPGSESPWFNRKEHRFALNGYTKSGINRVSAPQTFDFAAGSEADLLAWKRFFGGFQLEAASVQSPLFPTAGNQASSSSVQLDEQRQLERAMQLSLQDARRHSATSMGVPSSRLPAETTASAPTWNPSPPSSPQATLAPDGVEIVQQLPARPLSPQSFPPSAAAHGKAVASEGNECVVCFDGSQEAVCVPCGHNAVCMSCANQLLNSTKQCPVCRSEVREFIKLFRV